MTPTATATENAITMENRVIEASESARPSIINEKMTPNEIPKKPPIKLKVTVSIRN